jgi:adenosylcobinamide-GDP ribazoletransferase
MNAVEVGKQRLAEILAAFALLTRLAVPLQASTSGRSAVWAYPIVGAVVGALAGALYWIAIALSLPAPLAAIFAILAAVLATGALHEDGLADFCDGLGGATPADRLSIMRDRRIGSYGTIALILSLAARVAAVASIASPSAVLASLIVAGAAARASAVFIMVALPPARSDGLSASVGRPPGNAATVAGVFTFLLCCLLVGFGAALLTIAVAVAIALAVGRYARAKLGGQTGDVLGAAIQISECLTLALLGSH